MRHSLWFAGLLLPSVLIACRTYPPHDPEHELHNMWAGAAFRRASIEQAIVAQATLFPYHFEEGSPALNPLGERDLGVLGEHLRQYPRPLRLRRGDSSQALYEARLATVHTALADLGVDTSLVEISDGLPGGPRTWSETAIERARSRGIESETDDTHDGDLSGGIGISGRDR